MSNIIEELQLVKLAAQEQTAASLALSQEVAGKMAAIDARAAKLNQDVSDIIQSEMERTLIVSVDGDDANSGSSASPLATLDKALSLVPNGTTARIYLASATSENPNNVYDVTKWYDLESRNVVICASGGHRSTLRFMDGGGFTSRSGGSIKFSNGYNLTIEVVASRTQDNIVSLSGGDTNFGGYYSVYFKNFSPSLKQVCKTSYHVGDYMVGVTAGRAAFMRFQTTDSTETDFVLANVYSGGLLIVMTFGLILTDNIAIHTPDSQVQRVGTGNSYLISA